MSISDELWKLDELRRSGALSEREFEIAKRKVLEESSDQYGDFDQLEEIKNQNDVAQLDRAWKLERENYMIHGKYGRKHIPGKASSLFGGVILVAFGIFWTVMAGVVAGPFGGLGSLFPIFGVLFVLFGIGVTIHSFIKAGRYQDAQEQYHRRRRELTGDRDDANGY